MKSFMLTVFLSLLVCTAKGQIEVNKIDLLNETQGWNEGSIMLSDGTELKGLVRYNDREGFLSYQDGDNKQVFTSRSAVGFEFFDESLQRQRIFYTVPYEDSQTSIKRPLFFELIREYKTFSILSRADPIEIYRKRTTYGSPALFSQPSYDPVTNPRPFTRLEVSQVETIFIMGTDGTLKPYIEVKTKEDGMKSVASGKDKKSKSKLIDEDLLAGYVTQPVYDELKKYAEENDLRFKRKDDFLKILQYYDSIKKDE